MNIKIRESGEIRIIDFSGRLDTVTSPNAEAAVTGILDAGHKKIMINLAETEWVSSSGLWVLLLTAKKLAVANGRLNICQPNPVVSEILEISGFSTILNVCATEEEALAGLQL